MKNATSDATRNMLLPRDVMTSVQVAEYLNCHLSTIYRMVRKNKIPFFKVGSDYRFHRTAIDEWALTQSGMNSEEA